MSTPSIRLPAVACALLALALPLGACGSGAKKSTNAQTTTHSAVTAATPSRATGPESIFEAGLQLLNDPAGTLDTLRQLGVDRVKIFVPWSSVSPNPTSSQRPSFNASDPAAYPAGVWDRFDAIIRDANARGIGVDVTLSSAPRWALGPDAPPGAPTGSWKPSAAEFGQYVQAVGTRYSGTYTPPGASAPLPRVSMWSIWNEPNYGQSLSPSTIDNSAIEVNAPMYRGLLDAAWSALKATGHGHDTILIGEVGPHGIEGGKFPGTFGPMVPLRFIRALYCVDQDYRPLIGMAAEQRGCPTTTSASAGFPAAHPALFQAAGFADHPYPAAAIPPDQSSGQADYADLPALPNLEQSLDRATAAYGSNRKFPIYSTEYGYQTNPPRATGNSVPVNVAPKYLNQAEYMSWRDPRVVSYDQFLLQDPPNGATAGGFPSGLEYLGGAPKPGFFAFRLPLFMPVTSFAANQPIEVWGCVRPAHFAKLVTGQTQHARIEFKPSTGGSFKTIADVPITDPHGYFDVRQAFPGSGAVRLQWAYPHGPAIYSRPVVIQVR